METKPVHLWQQTEFGDACYLCGIMGHMVTIYGASPECSAKFFDDRMKQIRLARESLDEREQRIMTAMKGEAR